MGDGLYGCLGRWLVLNIFGGSVALDGGLNRLTPGLRVGRKGDPLLVDWIRVLVLESPVAVVCGIKVDLVGLISVPYVLTMVLEPTIVVTTVLSGIVDVYEDVIVNGESLV